MLNFTKLSILAVFCTSPLVVDQAAAGEDQHPGEWVSLFDGKATEGWKNPYTWGKVEVVDGEIHLTADKKFFLVTEKDYADFVFEGEINLPEGQANSGFMFRCHVEKNKVFGYQAEVDGSERRWSGGLYDEGRRKWLNPAKDGQTNIKEKAQTKEQSMAYFAKEEVRGALKRTGWNQYRIVCEGDHIQIFVNGVKTTDVYDSTDATGPIGIQHHGEKGQTYKFRNLRIKELNKKSSLTYPATGSRSGCSRMGSPRIARRIVAWTSGHPGFDSR